jgi:hypothetical protein
MKKYVLQKPLQVRTLRISMLNTVGTFCYIKVPTRERGKIRIELLRSLAQSELRTQKHVMCTTQWLKPERHVSGGSAIEYHTESKYLAFQDAHDVQAKSIIKKGTDR